MIFVALAGALLNAEEKPPVQAELVSSVRTFVPGGQFTVGIAITHQPGFHTYWHSPGTVGLATMVNWELPEGFSASELSWPVPERSTMEGYNTHGYNRDVVTTTWVGFDKYTPLGRKEFGGTAALPIWIDYMREALQDSPQEERPVPTGIVTVKIDPDTGQLASAGQRNAIFEYFKKEDVPRRRGQAQSLSSGGPDPYEQINDIPTSTLRKLMKLGKKITKLA